MYIDKYLYELVDEYHSSSSVDEKNEIIKYFCSSIWSSDNKRRTYIKTIHFSVRDDLLKTDIGQVFDTWSDVEFIGYKAMSNETDWASLIRQKVNNLYTKYCDKDVILKKDYMAKLSTPKKLYYQWIDGIEMDTDELTDTIDSAISDADLLKTKYANQKMDLEWEDYKKIIEGFFFKCFCNCRLIEDYEKDFTYYSIYDFSTEDNFYVSYFCKSIENYMRNYEKEYYGLKRGRNKRYKRCKECGNLLEITNPNDYSTLYCFDCKRKKTLEKYKKYNAKRRTTEPKS